MLPFDRPSTIVRWRFGWLTVKFPDGVRGIFSCWQAALFALEHEPIVRIR